MPKRSAPTCRKSRAASGSTTASARNSCMPGRASAARAFPKDTRALVKIALDHDVQLRIVEAVLGGQRQPQARDGAQGLQRRRRQPARQDRRRARPHLQARHRRHARGAVDPAGDRACSTWAPRCARTIRSAWSRRARELPDIDYCDDPYVCARGADALVIVTEWVQFRALDLDRLKREMAQPVVVDLRNIYRPEDMAAHGFTYESVGRASEPGSEALSFPVDGRACPVIPSCVISRTGCPAHYVDRPLLAGDDGVVNLPRSFDTPLPIDAVLDELARTLGGQQCRGAGGAARAPARPRGCRWRCSMRPGLKGKKIIVLEPRRIAARASAERMAKTLGRARRRDRRLSRPLRLENLARDPDRGRHRRHFLAADSRRSRTDRRRRRAVRRVSRTLARCRSGPGAGARRADRLARGSAHPGDVGDARWRAGRQNCSAMRR